MKLLAELEHVTCHLQHLGEGRRRQRKSKEFGLVRSSEVRRGGLWTAWPDSSLSPGAGGHMRLRCAQAWVVSQVRGSSVEGASACGTIYCAQSCYACAKEEGSGAGWSLPGGEQPHRYREAPLRGVCSAGFAEEPLHVGSILPLCLEAWRQSMAASANPRYLQGRCGHRTCGRGALGKCLVVSRGGHGG